MSRKNMTAEEQELMRQVKEYCEVTACEDCIFDHVCSPDCDHKALGDLEVECATQIVYRVKD